MILLILLVHLIKSVFSSEVMHDYVSSEILSTDERSNYSQVIINLPSARELDIMNINATRNILTKSDKLYLLNDMNNLYYMTSSSNSTSEASLKFMAHLTDINSEIIDVQAENWNNVLVVIVALDTNYNVYLIKHDTEDFLDTSEIVVNNVKAIQQIGTDGNSQQIFIFSKNDDLYALFGSLNNEGKLSLYKWRNSYFTMVDSKITFKFDQIFIYDNANATTVTMIVKYGTETEKASVQIITIDAEHRFQIVQNRFFETNYKLLPYIFNGEYYFYVCLNTNKCFIYKWDGQIFYRYHKAYPSLLHLQILSGNNNNFTIFKTNDNYVIAKNPKLIDLQNVNELIQYQFEYVLILNSTLVLIDKCTLHFINYEYQPVESVNETVIDVGSSLIPEGKPNENLFNVGLTNSLNQLKNLIQERQSTIGILQEQIKLRKKSKLGNIHIYLGSTSTLTIVNNTFLNNVNISGNINLTDSADTLLQHVVTTNINIQNLITNWNANNSQIYQYYSNDNLLKRSVRQVELSNNNSLNAKVVRAKYVKYNNVFFKDLLKRNQRNRFKGDQILNISTLFANNITVKSNFINNINLNDLVRSNDSDTLIKGKKTVTNLITNKLLTSPREELSNEVHLNGDNYNVKNVILDYLNNVNWKEFVSSIWFKNDNTKMIHGNLHLQNSATINNLVNAEEYITKNTDQVISRNVSISKFHIQMMTTNRLNGVRLNEDAAIIGQNNTIESPIEIQRMNVIKKLQLMDITSARHIVGTRVEDLSQIYSGTVTIHGSLKLHDLISDSENTQVLVGSQLEYNFSPSTVQNYYWLKSMPQNISTNMFTFNNQVISSVLFTNLINNTAFDKLLIMNRIPTANFNLIISSGFVMGNILNNEYESLLVSINQRALRRKEKFNLTNAHFNFRNNLIVNHFETIFLNGQQITTLPLRKMDSMIFSSTKKFANLTLISNINRDNQVHVYNSLSIKYYNDINLYDDFFSKVLYIRPHTETDVMVLHNVVSFDSLHINRLQVDNINNINLTRLSSKLSQESKGSFSNIFVQADLTVEASVLNLVKLNNINFNEYVELLVLKNRNAQIGGHKIFKGNTTVYNLSLSSIINNIDMNYVFRNVLLNNREQKIYASNWYIKNLHTKYLTTKAINNVTLSKLNYMNDNLNSYYNTVLHLNLKVKKLVIGRNMHIASGFGENGINIEDIMNRLKNALDIRQINNLVVNENMYIPLQDTRNQLVRLLNNTTLKSKFSQEINIIGDVVFENTVHINSLFTKEYSKTYYNLVSIDIRDILADSLKKSNTKQVIWSHKTFSYAPSAFRVNQLISLSAVETIGINGLNIVALNQSILRLHEEAFMSGRKYFTNPEFTIVTLNLYSHAINGVDLVNFVWADNLHDIHANALNIRDLVIVNNLHFYAFNTMPFNRFIENRIVLFKDTFQNLYDFVSFEYLIVINSQRLVSINNIQLDDLVMKKSNQLQKLSGKKTFQNVTLIGPTNVNYLNGIELMDFYMKSIKLVNVTNLSERFIQQLNYVTLTQPITLNNGLILRNKLFNINSPKMSESIFNIYYAIEDKLNKVSKNFHSDSNSYQLINYYDYDNNKNSRLLKDSFVQLQMPSLFPRSNLSLSHTAQSISLHDTENDSVTSFVFENITKLNEFISNSEIKIIDINTIGRIVCKLNNMSESSSLDVINIDNENAVFHVDQLKFAGMIASFDIVVVSNNIFTILVHTTENSVFAYSGQLVNTDDYLELNVLLPLQIIKGNVHEYNSVVIDNSTLMIVLSTDNVIKIHKLQFANSSVAAADLVGMVQLFQVLELDNKVRSLTTFRLYDKIPLLVVITTDDYYYLYKFNYIQGWLVNSYNWYENISHVKLEYDQQSKRYYLIVATTTQTHFSIYLNMK